MTLFPSNTPELSDQTFRQLSDFIYANSGLRYDESSKYVIQRRLATRIRELRLESYEKYYYYLMYSPNREVELEAIFDAITINETYFFREERQLRAFREEILPEAIAYRKDNRSLRIWSAGCSTAEEPYTVAMSCRMVPELEGGDVDSFASDISQKVIHTARRGIYGETSFRTTDPNLRKQYFDPAPDNKFRVKEEVRRMVTFGKV